MHRVADAKVIAIGKQSCSESASWQGSTVSPMISVSFMAMLGCYEALASTGLLSALLGSAAVVH